MLVRSAVFCSILVAVSSAIAQDAVSTSAGTATVPHLLKYTVSLPADSHETVVRVALYRAPQGGEPIWAETERIVPDASGRTVLLLGSATEGGLPQAAFDGAEARYVGVSVAGGEEQARTLLVGSAYSLKAQDAETLGGHPASDFALAGVKPKPDAGTDITQINVSSGILGGGTGPTVSLAVDPSYFNNSYAQLAANNLFSGTVTFSKPWASTVATGTAPFTVASTTAVTNLNASLLGGVAASGYPQLATQNTYAGNQIMAPSAPATTSTGHSSNFLWMNASVWNSSKNAAQNIGFQWRAEPLANDTASPNANFALLSTVTSATPQETGFKINANGIVTFVSGQTYPGAGTITSVTGGSPITATTTGGAVTLSLNTSALETTLGTVYAGLSVNNNFAGMQSMQTALTASNQEVLNVTNTGSSGTAIYAATNGATGIYGSANATTGVGLQGTGNTGVSGTGAYGITGISNSTTGYGVVASGGGSQGGIGVYATGYQAITATGSSATPSSGSALAGGVGVIATGAFGVIGETTSSNFPGVPAGVFGLVPGNFSDPSGNGYAAGVSGEADATDGSVGVYGLAANGYGVSAVSTSGTGLYANGPEGGAFFNSASGDGVYAISSTTSQAGVYGVSDTDTGYGVFGVADGTSKEGTGFMSISEGGGVWGDTGAPEGSNVFGAIVGTADGQTAGTFVNNSNNNGFPTIYAANDGTGGVGDIAPVIVTRGNGGVCGINGSGDVSCSGRMKTLVPVEGGARHVEVYSMQSAENWFEDFGSGELKDGRATVVLEPQFAQIANTGVEYHVFLTPHGDADVLFVETEAPGSFTVRESKGGKSNIRFDYRIVAKRNGHENERLADATEEMRGLHAPGDRLARMREVAASKPPVVRKPVARLAIPAVPVNTQRLAAAKPGLPVRTPPVR